MIKFDNFNQGVVSNNNICVIYNENNIFEFYNLDTMKLIHRINGLFKNKDTLVHSIKFSNDNKHLVIIGQYSEVFIFKIENDTVSLIYKEEDNNLDTLFCRLNMTNDYFIVNFFTLKNKKRDTTILKAYSFDGLHQDKIDLGYTQLMHYSKIDNKFELFLSNHGSVNICICSFDNYKLSLNDITNQLSISNFKFNSMFGNAKDIIYSFSENECISLGNRCFAIGIPFVSDCFYKLNLKNNESEYLFDNPTNEFRESKIINNIINNKLYIYEGDYLNITYKGNRKRNVINNITFYECDILKKEVKILKKYELSMPNSKEYMEIRSFNKDYLVYCYYNYVLIYKTDELEEIKE